MVVDNVVSMVTAGTRPQIRRGIAMADAEVLQIGHNGRGLDKRKATMELQAIGSCKCTLRGLGLRRCSHRRVPVGSSRNHNADHPGNTPPKPPGMGVGVAYNKSPGGEVTSPTG